MYNPDVWVILRIIQEGTDPIYKVLAGWYGGYAGSNSWQLNSGITKVIEEEHYYDVVGYSGSIYRCPKGVERMSMLTSSVYQSWIDKADTDAKIEVVNMKDILGEFNGSEE